MLCINWFSCLNLYFFKRLLSYFVQQQVQLHRLLSTELFHVWVEAIKTYLLEEFFAFLQQQGYLRIYLNGIYGSEAVWLPLLQKVFDRWGELTGITYVFEPNDDGAPMFASSVGVSVQSGVISTRTLPAR